MIVRRYELSAHEWRILEQSADGGVAQDGEFVRCGGEAVHGAVVDLLNMGVLERRASSAQYRPAKLGRAMLRQGRDGGRVVLEFTGSEWKLADPERGEAR